MNEHEVLLKESILTGQSFSSKEEATIMAGELLLENGYIEKEYIDSMLEKLRYTILCYIYRKWSGYPSWNGRWLKVCKTHRNKRYPSS